MPTLQLRATVGVYGGDHGDTIFSDIDNNGSCIALPSDYGYAIAKSVAFLQMFVRPVGDVLTNETVREVIEQEEGFATNFSAVRDNLASTAEQLYDLVRIESLMKVCPLLFLNITGDGLSRHPSVYSSKHSSGG